MVTEKGSGPCSQPIETCPIKMASAMRCEASAILATPSFTRSPMIAKLLQFLLEETLSGRAHNLKSYSVAVDGLGRSADYDVGDSYARVQMGRLRKMLQSHYAENGPVDKLCIYIQTGSYTLRFDQLYVGYPMLHRPNSGIDTYAPQSHPSSTSQRTYIGDALAIPTVRLLAFYRSKPIAGTALLLGFICATVAVIFWQQAIRDNRPKLSPILEIMSLDSDVRPEVRQASHLVTTIFANDLPRFKFARIRVIGKNDTVSPLSVNENSYRLFSRLEPDGEYGTKLYLSIDDSRADTLLWSRVVQLPADRQATANALIPILAEINGPMGIIATHDTIMTRGHNDGGYPCLLKYFTFMRTREKSIEDKVAACLKKPVKEQRMEATILAARALFAIENRDAGNSFNAASDEGIEFARAAVAADPNDGSANFVLARFSYLKKDCASARFYTSRTMESNPNNPVSAATLAALAKMCNYPDADILLDRAFLTQSPYFAKGRLLLILGALGQNRPEKIAEIASSDLPQSHYNRINYYLSESLIAASQGRRDDAVRYWQLFSETNSSYGPSADEKLRHIVALPAMRKMLVAYLVNAGVIQSGD